MKKWKSWILPAGAMALFLGCWEVLVHILNISLYILPAPSAIVSAMVECAPQLAMHSLVTLQEALLGLVISLVLAVVLAILMDCSRTLKHTLFPHLVISQTIPVMVLGPLFSIWFGFGMTPKVLMVIFMCFFPIVIAFSDALGKVNQKKIQLLENFGAKPWQVYVYCKIPEAAHALFSGLKVSATYCIGGAIVGEWLSASAGLGYYMLRLKNGYMLDKVFACVVVVILFSLLLHGLVNLLEYVCFPYRHKKGRMKK